VRQQRRCGHIVSDGHELRCGLTRATVTADCGSPKGAAKEDVSDCVPRLALRYARGERELLVGLDRLTREAVMATASRVRKRMEAGEIGSGAEAKSEMRSTPDREEAAHQGIADLSSMSVEELQALAARVRVAARERGKAERQKARILPALQRAKATAEARVEQLEVAIEAAQAGRPVNLVELKVRLVRSGGQARPTTGRRPAGGPQWNPEARRAQGERALRMMAKRHKWPPAKLAQKLQTLAAGLAAKAG